MPNTDPLAAAMGPSRAVAPPAPAELAPHLPELEILALIGQGGMGAVYRVRRRADGRSLALKVVRPEVGKEAAFVARFAREAEALERLRHPNIVAIHGHGAAGPWCWLLMDLVEGANLREVVATGRLSPTQTLTLVPPLCAALQYAHDQGVVHRDLKPENILLDAAGVPHLVDFGLAKLRDSAAGSDLTNTGAGMGTVHYMAPEQVASAKDVDHRADIYALGVVIYELLTGQLPLGRFEAPSQRVQVDVRIDEVVLKALERDPQRRWQQMRQVGQAVAAVEFGNGSATAVAGASNPAKGWQPWQVIVGICLPLIVILQLPQRLLPQNYGDFVAFVFSLLIVGWLVFLVRGRRWRILGTALGLLLVLALGAWFFTEASRKSAEEAMRAREQEAKLSDMSEKDEMRTWLTFDPGLPETEVKAFRAGLREVETACFFRAPRGAPIMQILEQLSARAGFGFEAVGDLTGHKLFSLEMDKQPLEDILRFVSAHTSVRFHWTGKVLQVAPAGAP